MKKMLNIRISIVLLLFEWCLLKVQCDLLPSIMRQTQNGPIEGISMLSALNQRYYSFQGIPYAEPPITGINPYTAELIDHRFKVR